MKKEHFPNLELCKKLTSIGFPQTEMMMAEGGDIHNEERRAELDRACEGINWYVCPNVMEMLEFIPDFIDEARYSPQLILGPHWRVYDTYAQDDNVAKEKENEIYEDTLPPNSIAEMIIWLVSKGHLSFENNSGL